MSPQAYKYTGPIDCSVVPNKTQCKGKKRHSPQEVSTVPEALDPPKLLPSNASFLETALTQFYSHSGANGLGEAYVPRVLWKPGTHFSSRN